MEQWVQVVDNLKTITQTNKDSSKTKRVAPQMGGVMPYNRRENVQRPV